MWPGFCREALEVSDLPMQSNPRTTKETAADQEPEQPRQPEQQVEPDIASPFTVKVTPTPAQKLGSNDSANKDELRNRGIDTKRKSSWSVSKDS